MVVNGRLLLIRHGRVDFDSTEFRQSPRGRQWDPPLDDRGLEQAELLALRLAAMDAPVVLASSPFRRCLETIEPFARPIGREPIVDEDLGEVFVGSWEGVRFEDLLAMDDGLVRERIHEQRALFDVAPGGESGAELRARVVPAIERLVAGVERGLVVVIAHGGVGNAYLGHVMGIPQDMFFFPENSSVSTVDVDDDRRDVRFLGDVAHLVYPVLFRTGDDQAM